jgi:hypothetical protein
MATVIIGINELSESHFEGLVESMKIYKSVKNMPRGGHALVRDGIVLPKKLRHAQSDCADEKYTPLVEVLDVVSLGQLTLQRSPLKFRLLERVKLEIRVLTT